MEQFIQKLAIIAITLLIAIVIVVSFFIIFRDVTNIAFKQESFATAEKLKSAINEACFRDIRISNGDKPIEVDLKLSQPIPANSRAGAIFEQFTGANIIRNLRYGDPQFIIYYEMFPPGEGVSWEFYSDFDYRVIAMLPPGYDGKKDLSGYISAVRKSARDKILTDDGDYAKDKNIDVIIGNVKLSEDFDPVSGEYVESGTGGLGEFFGLGEWDGNNFFFDNYFAISAINKSFLKYQPCGNNKFCIKSDEGIFTHELEYCDGIEYIQFDAEYKWTFRLAFWAEGKISRHTDFYFVSPCEINGAKVYLDDCTSDCKNPISYPIYVYTENGLDDSKGASHLFCLDDIEGGENVKDIGRNISELDDGKISCVRIQFNSFDDREGHCFSYDELAGMNMIEKGAEFVVDTSGDYFDGNLEYYILKPADQLDINAAWEIIGEYLVGQENPLWP